MRKQFKLFMAVVATGLAGTAVAMFAHAQSSSVFYVDPVAGADSNDGSSATSAFKTIQHALDLASPGVTINLAPGSYKQSTALTTKVDGTSSSPITIQGPETGKDVAGRYQAVVSNSNTTGGHVIDVNNSYYVLRGFTINGQPSIDRSEYPTDPSQIRTFKDSVQSRVVDGRLIYVGSADTTHDLTGIKVDDMWLQGAGGECVRLRNRATNNSVTNTTIRWCGMYGKGDDVSQYKYHNGEGVYIGTSPKSTTQPMYANDASTGNVVSDSSIQTYGSECFDVKENAHDNKLLNSECMYNNEPVSFDGSNLELRGDHNTVQDTTISGSDGTNIKLSADDVSYDKGGNAFRRVSFANSVGAAIKNKMSSSTIGEFCQNRFSGNGGGQLTGNSVGDPTRACIAADTTAPTASIASPADGSAVGASRAVTVTSNATDDRAVTRVELLIDGVPQTVDTASPYQFTWNTPATLGNHLLTVRAYDDYGNSTVAQATISVSAPGAPTGLVASAASASSIKLTWSAPSSVPASSYDVYRNGTFVANTASLSYTDSGLTGNTAYSYYVVARDGVGNLSSPSNTASATTPVTSVINFEAESGTLTSPMVSAADTTAQGGRYVYQASGTSTGKATYTFNVTTPGTYKMAWRTIAPTTASDSFYFAFDTSATQLWTLPPSSSWQWNNWTGPSVNLSLGSHKLTVYRSENGAKLDAIGLTLDVPTQVADGTKPFEAEAGTLTSGMMATSDASASGGKYVKATGSSGTASYVIQVPAAGTYMIGGYIKAANSSSDSFNVKVDSSAYQSWDLLDPTTTWTYDATSNPTFSLSAGAHTVTLQYREANASVDRLILIKQ